MPSNYRITPSKPVTFILTTVLLGACGKSSSDEIYHREVTDPDGITVVENGSLPAEWHGELPRLTLEEVARIGQADGPDELLFSSAYLPFDVTPDGGVGYWERRPSELRVYDADGAFRFRAGRAGSGPGEIRMSTNLSHVDGLGWIVAGFSNRIVLFDHDGSHINTVSTADIPGRILNTLTAHANGTFWYFANSPLSFNKSDTHLICANWETVSGDTVLSTLRSEMEVRGDAGLLLSYPQSLAMDADGRAWVNTSFEYQIEILGDTPGEHWRLRREFEMIPDPDYGAGAVEERWMGATMQNKKIYSRSHTVLPSIQNMQWVDNRELWVFTSLEVDSSRVQVDVFSAEGEYMRSFSVEDRLKRARFTLGHAWLLTSDEEDIPVLIRYRYQIESHQ
ncbi:hypothetical protein ACFL6R_00310 [Gemmatimonadota bacterium]